MTPKTASIFNKVRYGAQIFPSYDHGELKLELWQ